MQKLMVKFSYSELKIVDGKFICSMQEKQKKRRNLQIILCDFSPSEKVQLDLPHNNEYVACDSMEGSQYMYRKFNCIIQHYLQFSEVNDGVESILMRRINIHP